MKVKITKSAVDDLPVGKFIADIEIKGFIARRLPSGTVTFGFQYTAPGGIRRWLKLGLYGSLTVEEARRAAKIKAGDVADGGDPAAKQEIETARATNTVRFVYDQWDTKYAAVAKDGKPLRSRDAIRRVFERHVLPVIGDVSVYDLTRTTNMRGSITDMLDKVKSNGGGKGGLPMANRVYTHLKTVLEWWRDRDEKFVTQPMPGKKPGGKEKSRDRFLPFDEIKDFWRAADELAEPSRSYWMTVLLCGGRRGEVANMHTSEFEGEDWIIPGDRYKTSVDHVIPLTPALRALVDRKPEGCKSESWFVFSTTAGEVPISGFSKMKKTLDNKINAIRKREGRNAMKPWQIRDLRRSCRTLMVSLGIAESHAKAVTGHKMTGIDGVYNVWTYRPEKAAAIEKFAEHIRSLLAPAPDPTSENVLSFSAPKTGRGRPSIFA